MDRDMVAIGFVILLIIISVVVRFVVRAGANKAEDAIKNAWAKKKAQDNPPKQVSLAERYGQVPATTYQVACAYCGNIPPAEARFCNRCGAPVGSGAR